MICNHCGCLVERGSKFCKECGTPFLEEVFTTAKEEYDDFYNAVDVEIMKNESEFVVPVSMQETVIEPKEYKTEIVSEVEERDFNSPIIWLATLTLFALCLVLTLFPEFVSSQTIEPTILEPFIGDYYLQQKNIHDEGYAFLFRDDIYMSHDDGLYVYDLNFENKMKVLDEYVEYIYVTDDYIFYCDKENDYYQYDKNTKDKTLLLESVFYVQNVGEFIYYQNDLEGEFIYQYCFEDGTNTVINDEVSYNITVNEDQSYVYYTTANKSLYSIDLFSSKKELLASDVRDYYFDGKIIYYVTSDSLVSLDILTKETNSILSKKKMYYVSMLDDFILCDNTIDGAFYVDENGVEVYFDIETVSCGQVVGDYFVYQDPLDFVLYYTKLDGKKEVITEMNAMRIDYKKDEISE